MRMASLERGVLSYVSLLKLIRRRTNMSIANLVAAIDGVSRETRPEVRRSYMIAIKHGVKQVGDRLAAIDKRLDALERRN
jgi:hypothetical protein